MTRYECSKCDHSQDGWWHEDYDCPMIFPSSDGGRGCGGTMMEVDDDIHPIDIHGETAEDFYDHRY